MTVSTRKNLPLINYTSRDFESIKRDLNNYRKRYYSDISKDENQASFDDMMLDMIAYYGDVLSFYLDYSVNESFLDTAIEFNNILKHGKALGYKFKGNPSSTGIESFFIIVPSNSTGLGPNAAYIPILKKDSNLISVTGNGYILNEDVIFSDANNPIVVARVDEITGNPTAYAIKAKGSVISGKISQEKIVIGDFQKFLRISLSGGNISEIISVVDDQGNEYFEVDYLSQDIVYKSITNLASDRTKVPNIMRPFVVPRRFVVERDRNITYLQFGFGSDRDNTPQPLVDPSQILLEIHGRNYVSDVSFDPSNILGTNKLGITPANTSLTITYRVNTSDSVNAAVNSITQVTNPIVEFNNFSTLDQTLVRSVVTSIECTNETAIVGDVTIPSTQELKLRIADKFASQNRAVSLADYRSLIYSMPPKFGAVKRANVVQDHDSFKRSLNIYIISQASDGSLTTSTSTLKSNLKIWLNQGKMINDNINILDVKIVNIGIKFVLVADNDPIINKFDVLNNAVNDLRQLFLIKEDIGMPFSITKIYQVLQKVRGVVDVAGLKILQQKGNNYASTTANIEDWISADGRFINVPSNVILELKNVEDDLKGSVK